PDRSAEDWGRFRGWVGVSQEMGREDLSKVSVVRSWPEAHGGARWWWGKPSRVQRRGEDLHAVDEAGARTGAVGAGVDGNDRLDTGQLGPRQQLPSRLVDGCWEVVAAGHEHPHLWRRRLDLRPAHPHRRSTRTGQQRLAT